MLLLACMAGVLLIAVSDSGKQLTSDVTVTNNTGAQQTDIVAPFHFANTSMLASGVIGPNGLKVDMQNGLDDEVVWMPSPGNTAMLDCTLVNDLVSIDDTTDCNDDTDNGDIGLLPATGFDLETVDYFVFSGHWPYRILRLDVHTAGVFATDPAIVWEYCTTTGATCTTWTALENVVDATDGFKTAGDGLLISWDLPDDWAESDQFITDAYHVRARVTALVTNANYTTQPLGDFVLWEMGTAFIHACDVCDPLTGSYTTATMNNNASLQYEMFTGQDTSRTEHRFLFNPAAGNHQLTITDSLTPSLSDWSIRIIGGFDGESGTNRDIVSDGGDFIRLDTSDQLGINLGDCDLHNNVVSWNDWERHTIRVNLDSFLNRCDLTIDGILVASDLTYTTVFQLAGPWAIGQSGSIKWLEEFIVAIGSLDPDTSTDMKLNLEDLSTFTGLIIENSANPGTNDATPRFPTITEDLTANATNLAAVSSGVSAATDPVAADVLGVISGPSDFAAVAVPTVTLPGSEFFVEVSALESGGKPIFPVYLIWVFGGILACVVTLMAVFMLTRSLLGALMAAEFCAVILFTLGIFPLWVIFAVAVIGATVVVLGKGLIVGASIGGI